MAELPITDVWWEGETLKIRWLGTDKKTHEVVVEIPHVGQLHDLARILHPMGILDWKEVSKRWMEDLLADSVAKVEEVI